MTRKKTIEAEEHHRRPRSIGGTDHPSNISLVESVLHRHWHTLFGNMNAHQICNKINRYFKPEGVTIICEFINGKEVSAMGNHDSKRESKNRKAWKGLFGKMEFQEAISYINSVWLDPSYHLYIKI